MRNQKKKKKVSLELPEGIIQHVQSFMNGKEAARTSLLSKSWYHAWSTRPILAFDIKLHSTEKDFAAIRKRMLKSMKRYKKSNINLQKLEICIFTIFGKYYGYNVIYYDRLLDELLRDASELGVNELHLDCKALSHVPAGVFSMTSLTKLYICGKLPPMIDNGVHFSQLASLQLHDVRVNGVVLGDILLQCPLIEKLDLEDIYDISEGHIIAISQDHINQISINVSELHNLVFLRVHDQWFKAKVSFDSITKGGVVNSSVPEFHKLRVVSLVKVTIEGVFFTNFSTRFPCIEYLSLDDCDGYDENIQISSKSLKHLKFIDEVKERVEKAEFDVPNIRKFVFNIRCGQIPSLSFHTASKEWESEVVLFCSLKIIESSWFIRLREFLKALSLSRISLDVGFIKHHTIWVTDLPCSSTPLVENLFTAPVTHDVICALFRCCRPTFIKMQNLNHRCVKLVHELFIENQNIAKHAKCFNEMQSLLMYELEEIDVEILKEKEWQSTPLTKFVKDVDPARIIYDEYHTREMRFRLKWGDLRCTS